MRSFSHPRRRRSLFSIIVVIVACRLAGAQGSGISARSAPLLLPSAIAYDTVGNLYLAEMQRHTVRKLDMLGNISPVAGDGTQGAGGDGGSAGSAELNGPQGLAVDSAKDIFIADSGNHRIRRVDGTTGVISTVAGRGTAGFSGDGGAATAASLDLPRAVCLDSTGHTLFIADTSNHRVRRVDLVSGVITTIAGNGVQGFSGDGAQATAANLDSPSSMAIDLSGNLYIADTGNRRVRRIAAGTGIISTLAGTGATGTAVPGEQATDAALALPRGLTSDALGNLYIVDSGNHRLLRVDSVTGAITIAAGSTVQGFAGDGAPAVAAALDSPRAVALSPAGLLSIADSGNQRVRQLLASPGSETPLQTIAGLGAPTPGILSIAAPTVIVYGSGTATALLTSSTSAAGLVTFLDIASDSSGVIGTGSLAGNMASLSLANLRAGQHRIMATYAGDSTHAAAQTTAALLTVSPLALKVRPTPATMIYGSPLPVLTGSVDSVLPQDIGQIAVTFTASATPSSPTGSYPIIATLTGAGSANYILQPDAVDLVITPAASSVLLHNESPDGSSTSTLDAQVTSSTSGVPTGEIALLDNGLALQKTPVNNTGLARFTLVGLSAGAHALTAAYAGDRNFTSSSSPVITQTVAPVTPGDFTLAISGASSQLLVAGNSIGYSLAVQMTGAGVSSPIALTVSGLPPFTKASFDPSYVPPAAGGLTNVTMTVSSLSSSAMRMPGRGWGSTFAVLALSLPVFGLTLRRRATVRSSIVAIAGLVFLLPFIGCGDRINTAGQSGSAPQSYTLTVTGTATDSKGGTLQHSSSVVLKMNAAQ